MGLKPLSLKGRKFDKLKVIGLDRVDPKNGTYWKCRCKCGGVQVVRGSHLTAGAVHRCKECKFRSMRNPNGVGDMSIHYWNQVLSGAARRNIEVAVTKEEAYKLFEDQGRKCALSGVPIQFPPRTNWRHESSASFDRKDSTIGYATGNVQWVHKLVNRMKMNLSEAEFLTWCRLIVNRGNGNGECCTGSGGKEVGESTTVVA